KDRRAITRADIGALAIDLGRIMRHREIDLQDAAIGDAMRIEGDLHGFGMAGLLAAHRLVVRIVLLAAGIARDRFDHAVDMLEDALDAPEAPTGNNRDLGGCLAGRLVLHRRRHDTRLRRQGQSQDEREGEKKMFHASLQFSCQLSAVSFQPSAIHNIVIASEAKQSSVSTDWIASSCSALLAMTTRADS